MAEINPKCFHLSASSIAAFKSCPTKFRLLYREGIRPADETDSQRVGTNWHKLHQIYAEAYRRNVLDNDTEPSDEDADIHAKACALDAVVEHLSQAYAEVPASKTATEWDLERQVLLTCFIGYQWYWGSDPYEVLASELPFELPLKLPTTGLPLPISEVLVLGKIDHVIRWHDSVCVLERKSTSKSVEADSTYWDKSQKDTQVSMYALAFKDLTDLGGLLESLAIDGAKIERYGNTLYDVWHKPTIKPSKLTQAETAAFISTGEYCGQRFKVRGDAEGIYRVNDMTAEAEVGKSGKSAIKETVEMFGARLFQDIQARPTSYFARREIARTDAELRDFRQQLFAVYQAQKAFTKTGGWFENESQCRATFACPMIPICYGKGADHYCTTGETPPNFKRIFTPLTVKGLEPEE